ncbi:MAG: aminodeoxychorismate synthase component I [Chlorobium sp.]|nr:MAG: aminodeoxychorismate synthase component I [Chlorobium sp.]
MKLTADLDRTAGLFMRRGTLWFESAFCRNHGCEALLFSNPLEELVLESISGIEAFFRSIEEKLDEGYYLAGWFGYEAGRGFERSLVSSSDGSRVPSPLAWFGIFREPEQFSPAEVDELFSRRYTFFPIEQEELSGLSFNLSREEYSEKIRALKEEIAAGNVYQVNFTGRYRFTFNGNPAALFRSLRLEQPDSYTAYFNNGKHAILSFSPELFFRCNGRYIETMPMKGTAPRGIDRAADDRLKENLGRCEKNRAENLMIVDLLRNDLGRICKPGSVETKKLFTTETYPTLHQMVSTVNGELRDNIGLYDLFRALFPSGSVTGAPKIRAMQLISKLEDDPRGIYTGTAGFITPAREMVFNVAIRTVELKGTEGVYGSGSGIVWDSDPLDEYRECQIKAKIIADPGRTGFELFETMLWTGRYLWPADHLERLGRSAASLGFRWSKADTLLHLERLEETLRRSGHRFKVRLTLSREGSTGLTFEPFVHDASMLPVRVCLARDHVDSTDAFLYHKTTSRDRYNRYYRKATENGYSEVLFLNERGELTEGAISNIFIRKDRYFYTPPVSCGLLDGVFRCYFLATRPFAREKVLAFEDLRDADTVYIANSVRGLRQAVFTGDQISA